MSSNPTVQTAIDQWLSWMYSVGLSPITIRNKEFIIRSMAKHSKLLRVRVGSVDVNPVSSWVNDDGAGRASNRNYRLAVARCFFDFCHHSGYIEGNPAKLVRVNYRKLTHNQKETKVVLPITEEEVDRLLVEAADNLWWRYAIIFGRDTGLRLGDICSMEWASINGHKLTVWTDKRDKRVVLDITGRMEAVVRNIPREDDKYLWPRQALVGRDQDLRSGVSRNFKRLCERAGVIGKSFHGLRHAYITHCALIGMPIEHISHKVGHSSTSTTLGYIHTTHDRAGGK